MISLEKISLSYAGFYGQPFEQFIKRAAELGFSGVQLIPDQSPNLFSEFPEERLDEIRSLLAKNNLKASVHNVFYDINLVSLVPEIANFAFEITRKVAEFAKQINCDRITVHPGYMFSGWRRDRVQQDRFWESAITSIARLANFASAEKLQIFFENGSYYVTTKVGARRSPLHVGIDIPELARLMPVETNIGLCLDVGKVHASGESLDTFVKTFGQRIGQVQFSSVTQLRDIFACGFSGEPHSTEFIFEGDASALSELRSQL